MNGMEISGVCKEVYKRLVKGLITKAAFKYIMTQKQTHSKLDGVDYLVFEIQPYLKSNNIGTNEKRALV